MKALANFTLAHRRLVIVFWLIALLIGGFAAPRATERLTVDFSQPGQEGYEVAEKILAAYGTDPQNAPMMVVLQSDNQSPLDDIEAARIFKEIAATVPEIRLIDKTAANGDDVFSTQDKSAQFAYLLAPPQTGFENPVIKPLEDAVKAHSNNGVTAHLTGYDLLAEGGNQSEGPGVLVETLLGGLGALAVLLFVFASFLALVPLAIAVVAILSTFLVLLGLTYLTDMSFVVQFLIGLVGLGVAIDYSLLLVTRWREERDHGRSNHEAIVVAMETAGHAVVFSGLTVAISLLALVILPVPFLRTIGFGGMLIPLISVAVTVTMLPAILGGIGPKVDWPKIRHENQASKFWTSWARFIVRQRWGATVVALVILTALIIPVTSMKVGNPQSDSLTKSGPAFEAVHVLENGGVPKGVLTPMEILTTPAAANEVVAKISDIGGLRSQFVESGEAGNKNGQTLVMAIPQDETVNDKSVEVVRDVKSEVKNIEGVEGVAGPGAVQLDYLKSVYGNFPYVLAVILVVTYILLARAFRSLLLPLKAVILNVASLAATFGGLVFFWQLGYGSEAIYGIEQTGAITFWLPIMIFAFLFGLSMDYEVFILARMREEWDSVRKTNEAVITGLSRTGRLVTSAAMILFLAFLSLSTAPQTDIKLLATGLGFGILLDATVIRMLLVPALVSLFGKWNWYMPAGIAKILRVEPSPVND